MPGRVQGTEMTSQMANVNCGLCSHGKVHSGRKGLANSWVFQVLWDTQKRLFTEFIYYMSVTVLTTVYSLSY